MAAILIAMLLFGGGVAIANEQAKMRKTTKEPSHSSTDVSNAGSVPSGMLLPGIPPRFPPPPPTIATTPSTMIV